MGKHHHQVDVCLEPEPGSFLDGEKAWAPRPWPCKESAGAEAQRPFSYEMGITLRDEMSFCLSVGMGLCFSASLSQPYMGAQK